MEGKYKIVIKYTPFGLRADLYSKFLFIWIPEAGHDVNGASHIIPDIKRTICDWVNKFDPIIVNKTNESLDFLNNNS